MGFLGEKDGAGPGAVGVAATSAFSPRDLPEALAVGAGKADRSSTGGDGATIVGLVGGSGALGGDAVGDRGGDTERSSAVSGQSMMVSREMGWENTVFDGCCPFSASEGGTGAEGAIGTKGGFFFAPLGVGTSVDGVWAADPFGADDKTCAGAGGGRDGAAMAVTVPEIFRASASHLAGSHSVRRLQRT